MGKRNNETPPGDPSPEPNDPADPADSGIQEAGESDLDAAEERARKRRGPRPLRKRLRLPTASGKTSALVLVGCFLLTALVVLPLAWKVPPWIEAEIILGTWWVVWTAALTLLLHRGWRISDDHAWTGPRTWWSGSSNAPSKVADGAADGCFSSAFDVGSFDLGIGSAEGCGEACLGVIAVLGIIIALFFAAWFVIEVAIPGGAFVAYLLIRSMLARVANDHHGCEDSWLRAGLWGASWATIYTVPQALIVWLIHLLVQKAHAG